MKQTAKILEQWLIDREQFYKSLIKVNPAVYKALVSELETIRITKVSKLTPPWIKVTDRVPDTSIDVLVTDQDRIKISYHLTSEVNPNVWEDICSKFKVTHWMPLPEQPENK